MFLGHYAVALGAKRLAPRVSLGTLILAAQLVDLVWPIFLLLGIERVRIDPGNTAFTPLAFVHYPYTHSLVAAVFWSALAGLLYFALRRDRPGARVVAGCVASHWVLDLVSHRPDLPLAIGGGPVVGLGLWNSVPATVIVEGLLFAAGVALYVRATRPLNRTGAFLFWWLVAFWVLIYVTNLVGRPPPSERAIGVFGLLGWLFVPWGYAIDRNRAPREPPA